MQKSAEKKGVSLVLSFLILCVALFNGVVAASAAYYDEGNDGNSWETAYIINSSEDLRAMKDRSERGKFYKLTSDIDLSSETNWNNLTLGGYFDGQNHTIRLNSTENNLYAGLFLSVNVSEDQVCLKNLNVRGYISGSCTGTVVHYLYSGIVENCTFSGTIACSNTASSYGAGGIVAHLEGGTVRNCTVSADISGASYAGGIAGEMTRGKIENCTANVNLLSGTYRGGIVGSDENSYSSADLSGNVWPSAYPQIGTGQEGGLTVPNTPVTSSDTTTPARLHVATVSPVVLSEDILTKLARNISVDRSQIFLLTSRDFNPSEPPEPTRSMRQTVSNDEREFIAKLNTITVSRDGWYVFMVTVSDDLVGTSVSDIRLYGADSSDFSGSSLNASFGLLNIINGVTGSLEASNLFGVKLDSLPKQFLATVFFSVGRSFTVYFTKMLLLLLAGGCETVAGLGVISAVILGIFAAKHFRKKH